MKRLIAFFAAALAAAPLYGQEKFTFLTSWYAQAEHGGFYQAVATGLYKKNGLDVTIRMGGPQVQGMQLMLAGQADLHMGYDFQVLKTLEAGGDPVTVATSFQHDLQGLMTHDDVASLAALKDKTILVATAGRTSWWPWMKQKFGYTEEQVRPYTFNLQPFFADKNIAQQGYMSSEPFQAQKQGVKAKFFLFAHDGFPPYGTTIVATQKLVREKPDAVKRFVQASLEGWQSYMRDPSPGNALIKKDNPNMQDDQLAYALSKLKEHKLIDGGDAAKSGIGTMSDERWKKTHEYMVSAGLLKPDVDVRRAYTLQFVKDIKVMP
jgi:NitT/TauT family transport system substrate-binding protein